MIPLNNFIFCKYLKNKFRQISNFFGGARVNYLVWKKIKCYENIAALIRYDIILMLVRMRETSVKTDSLF